MGADRTPSSCARWRSGWSIPPRGSRRPRCASSCRSRRPCSSWWWTRGRCRRPGRDPAAPGREEVPGRRGAAHRARRARPRRGRGRARHRGGRLRLGQVDAPLPGWRPRRRLRGRGGRGWRGPARPLGRRPGRLPQPLGRVRPPVVQSPAGPLRARQRHAACLLPGARRGRPDGGGGGGACGARAGRADGEGGAETAAALRRRAAAGGPGAGALRPPTGAARRRTDREPRRRERRRRHRAVPGARREWAGGAGGDARGARHPRRDARAAAGRGAAPVRSGGLLRLAAKNLAADRTGALLGGAASAVGAAALVFFVALGLGVGDATRRMFPGDTRLVEVVPPAVSLGEVLGGGRLDDETVVQIPAVGVPRALLADDLAPGAAFDDPGPGGAVPVVISRRLVEIYNRTIAPSWNLRKLPPPEALTGLELPVRVGFSMLRQKTEDRVEDGRLRVAGFSDRVPLYAAAVPLETVRRLHREYGKADQGYSAVTILAARPDDVPSLGAAVRRMGLAVDEGERGAAERVGAAVALTTGALALLALLMCALAALAIAQSLVASVRARAKDLAVLVALGARPRDVRRLLMLEAALVGLSGGVLGGAVARLSAVAAAGALQRALPDFPLRPETLFAFPAWVYLFGVAVAVVSAALGALAPAAAAARIEPARVLS